MTKAKRKPKQQTFGVGKWMMRNGEKAIVSVIAPGHSWPLIGMDTTDAAPMRWNSDGGYGIDRESEFDLIGPWKEPKRKTRFVLTAVHSDGVTIDPNIRSSAPKPSPHAARAEAILLSDIATRRAMLSLPGASTKQKAIIKGQIAAIEWILQTVSAKEGN